MRYTSNGQTVEGPADDMVSVVPSYTRRVVTLALGPTEAVSGLLTCTPEEAERLAADILDAVRRVRRAT